MASNELETIGTRLRRLRLERGLSQRELGSPGVSYAYISRIEAGTRRPSVKALRMLARKLGVSPDYLETGSEIRDVDARELRLLDAELRLRLDRDAGTAREAFRALLDEANEAGDARSATRAQIGLALAAAHAGEHPEAVELLERVVEAEAITPSERPDVFATLGRSLTAIGAGARAIEILERCLAALEEEDGADTSAYVRFAGYLAAALTDTGDLGRAETVLRDALRRAEDGADAYTRIRLYWSLARLAESEGRSVQALELARRAVALLEATDDTTHLARAHLLCAWILDLQENATEALPHLEQAEKLLDGSADAIDRAMLRVEQAKCAAQLGRGDDAVTRAREALELVGEHPSGTQGNAWWALAEGLVLTGEAAEADAAFSRAVDLLDTNGLWREAARACRRWANVLRDSGRDGEALDALERATEYAVRSQPASHSPIVR